MTDALAFADWIELYNTSAESLALSRLSPTDGDAVSADSTVSTAPMVQARRTKGMGLMSAAAQC